MKKRDFLKSLSLATLGMPLYSSALFSSLDKIADISPAEMATEEDFWLKIRSD